MIWVTLLAVISFLSWIVFLVLAIIAAIRKDGKAKRWFSICCTSFVLLIVAIAASPKETTGSPEASNNAAAVTAKADASATTPPPTQENKQKEPQPETKVVDTLDKAKSIFENKNIVQLIEFEKNETLTAEEKKQVDAWISELKKPYEDQKVKDLTFMRTEKDEVEGTVFYTDKTSTKYVNTNALYAYIATKKGFDPTLRIKIQFYGSDWLFIQDYIFNIDGQNYTITPGFDQVQQDNDTSVWEWYDQPADSNVEGILSAVANSKKTILRYKGKQYHKDRVITDAEKKALNHVLNLYADLQEEAKWEAQQ